MRFYLSVLIPFVFFLFIYSLLIGKEKKLLVTNQQLEEMQFVKEKCEAENPNKECILMWDYYAVDNYAE